MRIVTLSLLFVLAGSVYAEDEIPKPKPRDMKGDFARVYSGKKVEVTGRVIG